MKNLILAAIAALSLGVGAANAAAPNTSNQQSGDQFNYTRGGGG
jgi:hypothetical protein